MFRCIYFEYFHGCMFSYCASKFVFKCIIVIVWIKIKVFV